MEAEKNAIDELNYIKKIIEDSRRIVADNGMGYIVWGVLVTIGMVLGYIKYSMNLAFDYIWAWAIIIALGWLFSFIAYYRKKPAEVSTFAGRIIGRLWFSFGVSMTVLGFGGYFSHAISGEYISAVIALVLGAAYYISSILYDWNWFKAIGVLWWAGGFTLLFVNDVKQFLIMAGLMIFGQIVPGIILYVKYKKQFSQAK